MDLKKKLRNEKGIVLIAALLLLLVLTLIGISSISSISTEHIISGNERLANSAFYAAEAGLEMGLNQLPAASTIPATDFDGGTSYRAAVSDKGLGRAPGHDQNWAFRRYQVNATGQAGQTLLTAGASRQIELQTRLGPFPGGTDYNN
jgi:Tfp pilus assembly protein PilX